MSFTDNEFNEQKSRLRIEAMEKEIQRLRTSSNKQSSKIGSLRRNLYVQLVFFVSLISILFFKGLILIPGTDSAIVNSSARAEVIIQKDTLPTIIVKEDTINQVVYNTHKGAIPKDGYDGIIFAIQIGAYTGIDINKYKNNLLGIKQDSYEGINQFTLGEFIEYPEAETFLAIIRDMGFKDAFIMAFKNGRRINIQNALAMRMNQKPIEKEVKEAYLESGTSNGLAISTSDDDAKQEISIPTDNKEIQLEN